MVDFNETAMRHYCRNQKCRSKLPTPVSNERDAFCARGCHTSFYRAHCRVCETVIKQPSRSERLISNKSKCRNAWKAGSALGRYHPSPSVVLSSETPIKLRVKSRLKTDRGIEWAIAANSARFRAPRRVLEAMFGHIPSADT
jgi:hypothetical protein